MRGELVAAAYDSGQRNVTCATYFEFTSVEMFREQCYYHLRGPGLAVVVWAPRELCWYKCPLVK